MKDDMWAYRQAKSRMRPRSTTFKSGLDKDNQRQNRRQNTKKEIEDELELDTELLEEFEDFDNYDDE